MKQERSSFYGMKSGNFDCLLKNLKMLPTQCLWYFHTGNYQGFSKRYQQFIFVHKFQSYKTSKLAVIEKNHKSPTTYISAVFYVVNRCSPSDPGSIPGGRKLWAPTASLPLDQNECITPHLKISLIPMWSRRIRSLALLLGHFMNTQINLISYHKMRIVPDSLRLTV